MAAQSQFTIRADRLAGNPHNIGGIAGYPAMTLHAFTRARFEREGRESRITANNPYKPGTMAADCWNDGRAYREGQASYGRGIPCPSNPAMAAGWNDARGYYLEWIERAEK